jgi:surfactin synthase thioesterase subunit
LKLLAGALAEDLSRFALDRPYVLLGHSMGAVLAFEMARSLRREGHRLPQLFMFSACRPPHAIAVRERLSNLPDVELVAVLQDQYGGIPPAVRDNPELQKLLLPALRADFQMIETYRYTDEQPLDVPFLLMGGTDDRAVSAGQLMEWRRHTTQDSSVRLLPGGHFFLFAGLAASTDQASLTKQEPTAALRVIITHLEMCLAKT